MSPVAIKKIRSSTASLLLLISAITLVLAEQTFAESDIFSSEQSSSASAYTQDAHTQDAHTQEMNDLPTQSVGESASEESMEEPAISATDAALRAQQHVDGKVMNVRQFHEENKILYGVKVLQKNGRIKTINVDANNGSIVE